MQTEIEPKGDGGMKKYALALLIIVAGFFTHSYASFEQIGGFKLKLIARCMVEQSCNVPFQPAVLDGMTAIILLAAQTPVKEELIILTVQKGMIVNGYSRKEGKALAIYDHDLDGKIDAVKIVDGDANTLDDRPASKMSDEEIKSLQEYFDEVTDRVFDKITNTKSRKT